MHFKGVHFVQYIVNTVGTEGLLLILELTKVMSTT